MTETAPQTENLTFEQAVDRAAREGPVLAKGRLSMWVLDPRWDYAVARRRRELAVDDDGTPAPDAETRMN